MDIQISPAKELKGTVRSPPSKSYTHRAVIISSLAGGKSVIKYPLLSGDTIASIKACQMIGAKIEVKKEELIVEGTVRVGAPKDMINVQNSGTTIRLMTAVASLCDDMVNLTGDESIRQRPMQPLLDALNQLGVKTTSINGKPPVSVLGPLKGGECTIPGDVSSQFISSLLVSCPLAEKDTVITLSGELKSRPYIDMTIDVLEKYGARIVNDSYMGFAVPGRQEYKAREYTVEGDYSSAAFILAAAALTNSQVKVDNLVKGSCQGDSMMLDILTGMGADVRVCEDSVVVKGGGPLEASEIDLSQSPDLLPIVAVLGALAKGTTIIRNVKHARFKESDRIRAMASELSRMGAKVREMDDGLVLEGVKELKGSKVKGWKDHRIIMALAIAALKAKSEVTIQNANSIGISFPNFLEAMDKIGVEISKKD